MKNHKDCKYYLPCGWCDKNNEKCIFEQVCEAHVDGRKSVEDTKDQVRTTEYDYSNVLNTRCVEHDWYCCGVDTSGWTYRCSKCGQIKKENYSQLNYPYVTPVWINPEVPDINKVGDFPPYYDVTCTSGYINTNKCPEQEIESIVTTNVTTSAKTEAQAFIDEVKAGELPKVGNSTFGTQYLDENSKKKKK